MAKIIQISTVSKKALKNMLPMGALTKIHKRLEKKGHQMHYNTVKNAFNEDMGLSQNHELVLQEAITLCEELKGRRSVEVSDEVAEQLTATGS